jgi:zinc/manganese transport system substrate-binding protein
MTVRAHPGRTAAVAGLAIGALTLAGCGSQDGGADQGSGSRPKVEASTSAWGSVAQAVTGDAAQVDSIINRPDSDPHSYESTPQDAAKISEASLVVTNGGGYDQFADKVLGSVGESKPTVQAMASEHHPPEDGEVNEHVWYDLRATQEVGDHIADQLSRIAPQQAPKFREGAAKFHADTDQLQDQLDQIKQRSQGQKVIATEPVAHYALDEAGLTDVTPEDFVHAVEADHDPSPESIAQVETALNQHQVQALVFNPQTESEVTKRVRETAERNHIPVVEMTETLPAGKTYVQWMRDEITSLGNALNQAPQR